MKSKNQLRKTKTIQSGKKKLEESPREKHQKLFLYSSIGLILIATFICFYPSFQARFTNWDDPVYVTENPLVTSLSPDNIRQMFTGRSANNYHPLTMLSLAIDYSRAKTDSKTQKKDPFPFHQTNIFLHLINVLLVFIFIYLLSARKWLVAAIAAFLFGMHPMHVESVSWISSRKDLLYAFFFVSSLILYVLYIRKKNAGLYIASIVVFILSCLSKPAAVPMVFVMFLIDYYLNRLDFYFTRPATWKNLFRGQGLKVLLEKIPFLLVGFVFILVTFEIQRITSVTDFRYFTLFQRMLFSAYGFSVYLFRLIFPFRLSGFYPYPEIGAGGGLPFIYYITLITSTLIILLLFAGERRSKLPAFGILFFLVMVILVLQFITVGKAIMADRYTYVSFIGPFFIMAAGFNNLLESGIKKISRWKYPVGVLLFIYLAINPWLSYERAKVWDNSGSLWTNALQVFPELEFARAARASYYLNDLDQPDTALRDYEILIKKGTRDAEVYNKTGYIFSIKNQFDTAIALFTRSIRLDSTLGDAWLNRGITYAKMKKLSKGIDDMEKAYKINPREQKIYINRAFMYFEAGQYDKSIADYDYLLANYPEEGKYFFYRGNAKSNKAAYAGAIEDFRSCLKLNPNDKFSLFNIAACYYNLKDYRNCSDYLEKAKNAGYTVDPVFSGKVQKLVNQ